MNIAFCINPLGSIGLGVTISSLIRNCSKQERLTFWFVCAGLSESQKKQIVRLLKTENFAGSKHFIDFNPIRHFGDFCSLHGDWTPYGRLLLSDIILEDQVLYLDSDLVVEVDVLEIDAFEFKELPLAAVGGGKFGNTLGSNFYIKKAGISPDLEYFNSGVLLLNLKLWREDRVKESCLYLARKYSNELPSHDQSLLNMYCAGKFAKLPGSFNCEWLAHEEKPRIAKRMIFHFVGSPKPWDPFGFLLNNGYSTYRKYLDHEWITTFGGYTPMAIKRVWNIRRSYMRCIVNRIKANIKKSEISILRA